MNISFGSPQPDFDWKLWLPVILAILTVVAGLIGYWWQKKMDRESDIALERRNLYHRYIEQVQVIRVRLIKIDKAEFDEWYSSYKSLLGRMLISSPSSVVTQLVEFDRLVVAAVSFYGKENTEEAKLAHNALTEGYRLVLIAMRKEVFPKESIDESSFAHSTSTAEKTVD